jgi:16S rRNA (adenine1518-N6/adenine1519-N6)-dimethyltransferase
MARQRLGQHFLDNAAWQARIVAKLPSAPGDVWVEIGPGRGQLTRHLASRAKRIVAIETDPRLAAGLRDEFSAHPEIWGEAEVVEGDVLTVDLAALPALAALSPGKKLRVYGNLPYYITSPILHHLFQWTDRIASIHIVIQREVAERITAKPGSRDYGYFSVACQYFAKPEMVLKIPPGAFRPPPKVDSALVAMALPGERAKLNLPDHGAFLKFVQACFAQKRKTLRNNLLALAPDSKVQAALATTGLASDARAEQLSVPKFADLMCQIATCP